MAISRATHTDGGAYYFEGSASSGSFTRGLTITDEPSDILIVPVIGYRVASGVAVNLSLKWTSDGVNGPNLTQGYRVWGNNVNGAGGNSGFIDLWYLKNPEPGARQLRVDWSCPSDPTQIWLNAAIAHYRNVADIILPPGQTVAGTESGTTVNLTVDSNAAAIGSMIVACFMHEPTGGQEITFPSRFAAIDGSNYVAGGVGQQLKASSTTIVFGATRVTGADYAAFWVELTEAAGAGLSTTDFFFGG